MMLRTITTWEMFVAAAAGLLFMVRYTLRSNWRASVMGRHLMTFMGVMTTILVMWGVARLFGPVPLWIWAVLLGAFDAALIWRVALLWRTQHANGDASAAMYGTRRRWPRREAEPTPAGLTTLEPETEGNAGD